MKLLVKKIFYIVFSIIGTLLITALTYETPIFTIFFENERYKIITSIAIALLCVLNFIFSYRFMFPPSEEELIHIDIKKYEISEIKIMFNFLRQLLFSFSLAFNQKKMKEIDTIARNLKVGIMSGKNAQKCNTNLNELRETVHKTQLDFDKGNQVISRIQAFIAKSAHLSDRVKKNYSKKAADSQKRLDAFYEMFNKYKEILR